ncbi:MAG: tetratricopeptide repeat protein [Bacteroidetes bacterium]|nr:tetratricopeptide repeat protein [Bacteroidota bacterium]
MKKQLITYILIIIGFIQVKAQTTDNEWYLTALGAFRQEKIEKAKNAFTKIHDIEPEMAHLQARIYLAINQPDSAIQVIQHHDLPETYWLLAVSYAQKNQTEDAIKYLKQYLKFNTKRSEAEIKLHPKLEAIAGTKLWNDLWLTDWYSHHEKSIAEIRYLIEQEDFFSAIDTLNAKVKEYPDYAQYYYYLAITYNQIGKHEQALGYIEKAVELERTDERYRLQMANIQYALNDYEDAINNYTYYLRLNPDDFEVYLQLAEGYAKNKESRHALRELDEYLSYLPMDDKGLMQKANIAYGAGDYLTALSTINLYFKHHKPRFMAYKLRGRAYFYVNMPEYAIRDLSQALDFNPNDAEVYYYRGMARLNQENKKGACADFKKSYQLGYRDAYNQFQKHCE